MLETALRTGLPSRFAVGRPTGRATRDTWQARDARRSSVSGGGPRRQRRRPGGRRLEQRRSARGNGPGLHAAAAAAVHRAPVGAGYRASAAMRGMEPLSRPEPPPPKHRGLGFSIEALMSPAVPPVPSLLCMWPAAAADWMRVLHAAPHGFFPAAAPRSDPRYEPATGTSRRQTCRSRCAGSFGR